MKATARPLSNLDHDEDEYKGDLEISCAEFVDPRTVSDVPISNGYLTRIADERARRERPDFIAPTTTNEVQKALVGKPLEKIVRFAPVIQEKELEPKFAGRELSGIEITNLSAEIYPCLVGMWVWLRVANCHFNILLLNIFLRVLYLGFPLLEDPILVTVYLRLF